MTTSILAVLKQAMALLLTCTLMVVSCPLEGIAYTLAPATPQATGEPTDRLEQLVAPIALYPDALVAQVLAGSTYPTQIVEADRWIKQNSNLHGEQLGKAVDQQAWDVSVKALTQFPAVLEKMSTNLSWTSALGDAYFNEPQEVMATVQRLRKQAKDVGNLKSTKEQTVTTEGQTIIIQPANPQVVYVPTYNPTVVYGAPVPAYPGYSGADLAAASIISFGIGMAVGAAVWGGGGCCSWGWNSWGCGWHGGTVVYNRNTYVSNSNNFVNRNSYYHNNPRPTPYGGNANVNRSGNTINRGGNLSGNNVNRGGNTINRGGNTINVNPGGNQGRNQPGQLPARGENAQGDRGNRQGGLTGQQPPDRSNLQNRQAQNNANRGFGQAREPGTGSNAFSGYTAGGNARAQQSRGQSSFGGGNREAGRTRGGGGRRR